VGDAPTEEPLAAGISKATFRASIPPIMSGIKTGSDGMRLQLDIPESDMGEAVKLLAMRGMRLVVTVEMLREDEPRKSRKIHI
jgi:hypothetical protein